MYVVSSSPILAFPFSHKLYYYTNVRNEASNGKRKIFQSFVPALVYTVQEGIDRECPSSVDAEQYRSGWGPGEECSQYDESNYIAPFLTCTPAELLPKKAETSDFGKGDILSQTVNGECGYPNHLYRDWLWTVLPSLQSSKPCHALQSICEQ